MTTDVIITQKQGPSLPKQWHFICRSCSNHLPLQYLTRQHEHEYDKTEVYLCQFCASGEPVPLSALRHYRLVQLEHIKGDLIVNGMELRNGDGALMIASTEIIEKLGKKSGRSVLYNDKRNKDCPLFGQGVEFGNQVVYPEDIVVKYLHWRASKPTRQSSHATYPGAVMMKGYLSEEHAELFSSINFWTAEQLRELGFMDETGDPTDAWHTDAWDRGETPLQFQKAYRNRKPVEDATE